MSEKKDKENKKGIAESFLGGIPVLGDLVRELGKTETFKKRFAEVDEKIKENLEKGEPGKGEKKRWGFEANIAVRPIINEVKKESAEISIKEDYFYGKKGKSLTLAVKVPKKEVGLKIDGKNLLIDTGVDGDGGGAFPKKIELPDYYRSIKRKKYQEGILVLELTK